MKSTKDTKDTKNYSFRPHSISVDVKSGRIITTYLVLR